jgi:hypothetical protein
MAVLLFAAFFTSVVALTSVVSPPRDAYACSVGPPMFPLLVEESSVIALVDVTVVGGAANTRPTVTPRATETPTATPTPGSPTPTIDPVFPRIESPTASATATPFDLTGYGATGTVLKTYKGDPQSPLIIDAAARANLEQALRAEANRRPGDPITPCPAWLGLYKYAPGQRYVLFGDAGGDGIETVIFGWWEVRTDERGELYVPLPGNLMVTREIYETYLRDLPGTPDERWYWVSADRMPFDTFERIITGAPPARPPIVPPITGSAGLKR